MPPTITLRRSVAGILENRARLSSPSEMQAFREESASENSGKCPSCGGIFNSAKELWEHTCTMDNTEPGQATGSPPVLSAPVKRHGFGVCVKTRIRDL